MDFDFCEEDRMIRKSVKDMLEDWSNIEKVRSFVDNQTVPDKLKEIIGELGILGILDPDPENSNPKGMIAANLIAREAGKALLAYPLIEGIVGLYVLKQDMNHSTLSQLVEEGKKLLTIAWETPSCQVVSEADALLISGKIRHVPFAYQSDVILASVSVADKENAAEAENMLVLIDRYDPAVTIRNMKLMDETYPLYEVTLSNLRLVNKDIVKGSGMVRGKELSKKIQDIGAILLASEMAGGAERVLNETVEYTKIRKQYGTEISRFQAVQHIAADMWVLVENMKVAVDYAACALESETDDWKTAVLIAKSYASDSYKKVTGDAIQLHGGIGYTSECDMQLFFKRARRCASVLGDGYDQRERLASEIFGHL